jgi:glycine/D-amino acid oxidase-like deaminating enzyme
MGAMAETVGSVFWLEQALALEDGEAVCPPLAGTVKADVCVVGGGFLGMWAALEVVEQAPDAKVVLIEAEGLRASARAGAMAGGSPAGMTSWRTWSRGSVLIARGGWRSGRRGRSIGSRRCVSATGSTATCAVRVGFGLRRRRRRWARGRVRSRRARVSGGRGSSRGWAVASYERGPARR